MSGKVRRLRLAVQSESSCCSAPRERRHRQGPGLGRLDVMAKRAPEPEKRPGFFSQIKSLFRFTREAYPWLPWAQAGILVGGILLGLVAGYLIPPFQVWTLVLWGITGLMLGVLGALFLMTRLSTSAMYTKIDGMPGATGHVLSTSLGRRWQASETPVGINPKTQEAVYRTIGRGGIVVVGEGARGRLTRLVNEERSKAQRVAHGVPVTVLYVGHGEDEVPIADLAKTIKKLPKAIDKATMAAVIRRVDSVSQSLSSLPIPKGIDPTKVRPQRPR
ncbi:DUF4191 domain-containing protein [Aneurinibacillus sp. BA2021]|nr:DUF4191 domain-containing protein [Aneurinibacillus sp. BA2021]